MAKYYEGSGLKKLDLAFAMDCTGSMGSYIQQAQDSIREIATEIARQEKADLQLALIEYRDHPPQDSTFVTNALDFTWSINNMKARLDACSATGGGDTPEAVVDAMHALLKLNWRDEATKVCVFISDAPPHGLGCSGDGFPEGCPCGLDPMVVMRDLAEKGITIYMVGCEPAIAAYRDWFMALAYVTGGQYVPLSAAKLLPKVIISGTQEEISLQALLKETTEEIQKLSTADEGSVDQSEVEKAVFKKLQTSGVKTKHLTATGTELPSITKKAIEISQKHSLAEVRAIYSPDAGALLPSFGLYDAPAARSMSMFSADSVAPSAATTRELDEALDYAAVESEVSYSQAVRLTQRTLHMTGLVSKCAPSSASAFVKKE
jgi:hypothetical protein